MLNAQKQKGEDINLLPQIGFQSSTAGRVLAWILSTFRIIVIITEIIVMVAFLSRFWFDAQNSELNEEIQQKQAVLSASLDFETRFRDAQKRLTILSAITSDEDKDTLLLESVKKALPPDVILTKVLSEKDNLQITASTPNEQSVQQFIVNLSDNQYLLDLGMSEASTSIDNPSILSFTLNAIRGDRKVN